MVHVQQYTKKTVPNEEEAYCIQYYMESETKDGPVTGNGFERGWYINQASKEDFDFNTWYNAFSKRSDEDPMKTNMEKLIEAYIYE